MNSRVKLNSRITFLVIAILLVFGAVLLRLSYLHVWGQKDLLQAVERNRQKFDVLHACRGNILDTRGNLLAGTRSVVDVGVDPQVIRAADRHKWKRLARLLGLTVSEIEEKFLTKFRKGNKLGGIERKPIKWQTLAKSVPEKTYEKIMKLSVKGVYGNRRYERYYPHGRLASHVLGFINKEDKAICGVERYMNFYLNGQNGWVETEKDGRRRELGQFRKREVQPQNGSHIELTIDSLIQDVLEKEIDNIVQTYQPKGATIIVSEPSTGYILGLVNYPSFNPNRFWEYDIDCHRNRAVTDLYEPGSPFKIVTASASLSENVVQLDDEYDCSKTTAQYRGRTVKLPKDHKPYNILTAEDVIKKSSNRGVAHMAMALGEERLVDYIKNFGFGQKLGWEIDLEARGVVHDPSTWDGLTISRLPMGHAINCTALQMNYAMAVIANNGILMKPQVVRRIVNDQGHTLEAFQPKAQRQVIRQDIANKMTKLLVEVVGPEGTSGRAAIEGVSVAGKSGTSQKIIQGEYSPRHHVGSFSGFFPSNNPRVVMTIVIDDAKRQGVAYGGIVAAPSFRNIGQKLVQYLNLQPHHTSALLASKQL